jgi:hypothetical protein
LGRPQSFQYSNHHHRRGSINSEQLWAYMLFWD